MLWLISNARSSTGCLLDYQSHCSPGSLPRPGGGKGSVSKAARPVSSPLLKFGVPSMIPHACFACNPPWTAGNRLSETVGLLAHLAPALPPGPAHARAVYLLPGDKSPLKGKLLVWAERDVSSPDLSQLPVLVPLPRLHNAYTWVSCWQKK